MTSPLVFLNSRFIPLHDAHLTLHDAGFIFGATVTDLVRTFRRKPFCLPQHLARFRQSCTLARIAQPIDDSRLTEIANALVEHNGSLLPEGGELALVLFATPGPVGFYLGEPGGAGDGTPTVGLHTFPLPFARYRRLFTEGAHLHIPTVRAVPQESVDPSIKHRSRLVWWLAEQETREQAPGSWALLADASGCLTETAAANFLLVQDGCVWRPPRGSVLDGISMGVVEELCREMGTPFAEKALSLQDCRSASEALLTGTSFCVAGVRRVGEIELPWPGPICRNLLQRWSERVGLDIREQILSGP
jgi:branched-chain amino acid aminotransferase